MKLQRFSISLDVGYLFSGSFFFLGIESSQNLRYGNESEVGRSVRRQDISRLTLFE